MPDDEFDERFRKRATKILEDIIHGKRPKQKTEFADPVEEAIYHPQSAQIAIKPATDTEIISMDPLGLDFTKFASLKQIRIRPIIPSSYQLMKFIRLSLKQKLQGLAIVSRQLFSNDVYKKIHDYYKKAKTENDYDKLRVFERVQARLFWQNVKKYAQRRGVPFKRRLTRKSGRTEIDLLNHRLNIVGNRLRRKTLETIGKGKLFFKEVDSVHKTFSSLDSIEAIRPVLYFVVIRSLSVPFSKIRPLVDQIISIGIEWTNDWLAGMVSTQHPPKKISYYNLCHKINTSLRELGVFRFKPYQSRKVTGYYSMEEFDMISEAGVVHLEKQTAEQKAGEQVHQQILSQFPQPINLPPRGIILDADYPQIIAETIIRSKLDTYVGKPDILIFGKITDKGIEKQSDSNLMIIADIKTYDSSYINLGQIRTLQSQLYQVEQYCSLIRDHGFSLVNTIKAIIHLDRKQVPESFIELIQTLITVEIEELKYKKEHPEEFKDLEHQFDGELECADIVFAKLGVKITYWK